MAKAILITFIIVVIGAGLAYYSLVVNDNLFTRFLFFLFCAAVIGLIVIKGIQFILPREDFKENDQTED